MKSSYELRAQKFVREIFPYFVEQDFFNNSCVYRAQYAVQHFCLERKRKVLCNYGSSRIALLTSDYVVKIDYNKNTIWGNSEDELFNWEKYYSKSEYSEYFAPISKYTYSCHDFYIMPRVKNVGRYDECKVQEEDEDFWDWLCDNVGDFHDEQFGKENGHFVIIDYACPRP